MDLLCADLAKVEAILARVASSRVRGAGVAFQAVAAGIDMDDTSRAQLMRSFERLNGVCAETLEASEAALAEVRRMLADCRSRRKRSRLSKVRKAAHPKFVRVSPYAAHPKTRRR